MTWYSRAYFPPSANAALHIEAHIGKSQFGNHIGWYFFAISVFPFKTVFPHITALPGARSHVFSSRGCKRVHRKAVEGADAAAVDEAVFTLANIAGGMRSKKQLFELFGLSKNTYKMSLRSEILPSFFEAKGDVLLQNATKVLVSWKNGLPGGASRVGFPSRASGGSGASPGTPFPQLTIRS